MNTRDLEKYSVQDKMLQHDLGVGVVTIYQLNNGLSYFVMGEYHNKGALSPTVGARFNKDQNIHDNIKNAFSRKRLDVMHLDNGDIDKNIYYASNKKQGLARLTFIQHVQVNLSEDEFRKKYIEPMHNEALLQRGVSEFFWKLNETLGQKESKFKFKSSEERSESAKKALICIESSRFPLDNKIIAQLKLMQEPQKIWEEKMAPLEFYGKNGGRKYSELTGFYLISLPDLEKQLCNPKIKADPEKPTVYIEYKNQPKEERWKRLFIFEEEINLLAEVVQQSSKTQNNPSLFQATPFSWSDLPSLWNIEKINSGQLLVLSEHVAKLTL